MTRPVRSPTPRIDVLIPAHNAEATVEAALASIQDQSVRDIRLIVVNDGSTDRTPALLDRIAADDRRLLVLHTPNEGIVAALNLALSHATAPLIARHDADDLAFPDRFARQLAFLDQRPDCVAVSGNAFHIDEHGRRTGYLTDFDPEVRADAEALPALEPYLMHPFLMVRRNALETVGGYRHVLHAEDADLYWRLSELGTLSNLAEPLGDYRVHAASISSVSVVNGRIAAIWAERAALSHRRRQRGEPDLWFPPDARRELRAVTSIDRLLIHASTDLTPGERDHLRLATAAKLIQLATYRPWLLALADCRLIGDATPSLLERMGKPARRHFRAERAFVVWRLLRAGRRQEARALGVGPPDYLRLVPILTRRLRLQARRRFRALRKR